MQYISCERCRMAGAWMTFITAGPKLVFKGAKDCPDCGGLGMLAVHRSVHLHTDGRTADVKLTYISGDE